MKKQMAIVLLSFTGFCQAMYEDVEVQGYVGRQDWDHVAYQVEAGRISAQQLSRFTYKTLNEPDNKGYVLLDRLIQYLFKIKETWTVPEAILKNPNRGFSTLHVSNEIGVKQKAYPRLIEGIVSLVSLNLVNKQHSFDHVDNDKQIPYYQLYQEILVQSDIWAKNGVKNDHDARFYAAQLAKIQLRYVVPAGILAICLVALAHNYWSKKTNDTESDNAEIE